MIIGDKIDRLHLYVRKNIWFYYFSIFCRIALAVGFIPSGIQKILGERFTTLSVNHPLGNFLESFHHTGYYYPFVGWMQVIAAILLLIPRTATIGAFIYFPIILNICVLSLAVRFDGSQVTSPLMLCAVLYLLCWDYHKFKHIFSSNECSSKLINFNKDELSKKFPLKFFVGVFIVICLVIFHTRILYKIMPRNTISDCRKQCEGLDEQSCLDFCECIHTKGLSLSKCLDDYNK